eukprot:9688488-Karenia_brevis.AAC.1
MCHACARICHHCDNEYCNVCLEPHMRLCPQNPKARSDEADDEDDEEYPICGMCGETMDLNGGA